MMLKVIPNLRVPCCFSYVLLHINLLHRQLLFSVSVYFRVIFWMNYIMDDQKLEVQLLIASRYIFIAYLTSYSTQFFSWMRCLMIHS